MNNKYLISSLNNFGIYHVKSKIPGKKNIISIKNYYFEISLKTSNINFITLSNYFSEKIILELSNYLSISLIDNIGKPISSNWTMMIDTNKLVFFLCNKYIEAIIDIDNLIIIPNIQINNNKVVKQKKPRKKNIPVALKRKVWSKWIGENIGKTKCPCCKLTDITQLNFSCGHIDAEANGGSLTVENLRPICTSCNSSMGTQNMNEFIKKYGL